MSSKLRICVMMAVIGLALAGLSGIGMLGRASQQAGQQNMQEQRLRLANLARSCEASVRSSDGYGIFHVARPMVVSGESGEIRVPCAIQLERGGSLTLRNVNLRTRHLIVHDSGSNGQTRLRIESSTLEGMGDHGFVSKLVDPEDYVAIEGSTIDYRRAVWALVGGVTAGNVGGGNISVTNSTVRSRDEASDGIRFMASENGGVGRFIDLELESVPADPRLDQRIKKISLVADECQMEGVEGYQGACDLQSLAPQP